MFIKNNRLTFTIIFAIAIFLMLTAFVTINNSILKTSLKEVNVEPWNIKLNNVKEIENNDSFEVELNGTRMNVYFNLDNAGAYYSYLVDVINNSSYKAKINNIDIERVFIGSSDKSGKSYYLSDYIDVDIINANNEKKIVKGTILNAYSINKYKVSIHIKKNLSSDEIYVLGFDKNTKNKLISINIDYQQAE